MRRYAARSLAALAVFAHGSIASAQVTTPSDEDPAPDGSLRAAIEASASGETITIEIPGASPDDGQTLSLRTGLVFDNTLILDGSSADFPILTLTPPDTNSFLEIRDGVSVTLRDIGLGAPAIGETAEIELLGGSSRLVVDAERGPQILSADLVGAGSFTKEGAESVLLLGTNTLAGQIVVREGELRGDSISLAGPAGGGDLVLAPNGVTAQLVLETEGSDFYDGAARDIVDASTNGGRAFVVKRGEGDLNFRGAVVANSIGIVVEEGSVSTGASTFSGTRSFQIDEGATLATSLTGTTTHAGRITGAGTLRTTTDNLTLTGDLTGFSGEIEVLAPLIGSLSFSPSVAPATPLTFSVDLDGTTSLFTIVDDAGLTLDGSITGAGRLAKSGTGITVLRGVTAHTGGTSITAGTLRGSTSNLQGNIDISDGGSVEFDQTSNGTFVGSIANAGAAATARKFGAGLLTLNTNQNFSGLFALTGGGLRFENDAGLPNARLEVGVAQPAGSSRVEVAFDPSQSPAGNTLNIGDDLVLGSGGQLVVDLDDGNAALATPTNTRVAVGGSAALAPGAELIVQLQPGQYAGTQRFDVLTAAGGVSGDFNLIEDYFFFDITGAVAGSAYQVTVARDAAQMLANIGATENQQEIGGVLDSLLDAGGGGDPSLQSFLDDLSIIQGSTVGSVLESLSPDDLTAQSSVRLASASRTFRGLSNRLAIHRHRTVGNGKLRETRQQKSRRIRRERRARRTEAQRLRRGARRDRRPPVNAAPPNIERPTPKPWIAWFEGSGLLGVLDSQDAKSFDYNGVGPLFGADAALLPELRLGFATGGTRSSYETEDNNADGEAYGIEASLYAAYTGEPIEALLAFRYGHSWIETDRTIRVGTGESQVNSDFEGDSFGLYAEFTRAFGSLGLVEVAPLLSVAYQHIQSDEIEESGTSALRFSAESSDLDSALTSLGLRLGAEREMDGGFVFRPRLKALWNHEWADTEQEITGRFAAGGTGTTRFVGAERPRDHGEVGLGWDVGYGPNANLFLDWNGRFGEDLVENALSVGARVAW